MAGHQRPQLSPRAWRSGTSLRCFTTALALLSRVIQRTVEVTADGHIADKLQDGLEALREAAKNKVDQCQDALFDVANTLVDGTTQCHSLFENVTMYFENFGVPDVDVTSLSFDFGVPDAPEVDFDSVCDAGSGCLRTVADLLDTVDEECSVFQFGLLPSEATFAVRLVRATASSLCVQNDGEFCFQGLIDAAAILDPANINLELRDVFCSECSLNLQRELIGIFETNFLSIQQLQCIDDLKTGEPCQEEELRIGVLYALDLPFISPEAEELCDSTCEIQAAALSSPLLDHPEIPSECFQRLGEAVCLEFEFTGLNMTEIDSASVSRALEKDIASALRTFSDYVDVTKTGSPPHFEACLTHWIDGLPTPSEEHVRDAISSSPLRQMVQFESTNTLSMTDNPTVALVERFRVLEEPSLPPSSSPTSEASQFWNGSASITAVAMLCLLGAGFL